MPVNNFSVLSCTDIFYVYNRQLISSNKYPLRRESKTTLLKLSLNK